MCYFCFTEIEEVFGGILEKEQDVSAGMAAIRTLLTVLEHDTCKCILFRNVVQINTTPRCRFRFVSDPIILYYVKVSFKIKSSIQHVYLLYT